MTRFQTSSVQGRFMTSGSKLRAGAAAVAAGAVMSFAGGSAQAQTAGTWLVKGGFNGIAPSVKSGDLSAPSLPGSQVDIASANSLIASAVYMLSNSASVEFVVGLPYKHDIQGAGSLAGVGKLGTIKQISPTVFAQYRFMAPTSTLRPYLGVGLTYAYFYGAEGSAALTALTNTGGPATRLSSTSGLGVSPQVGVSIQLHERWYLDAAIVKTFLKNSTTLSTGQKIDTTLNPISTNVSIGYRF
jgi:outer membrane protein